MGLILLLVVLILQLGATFSAVSFYFSSGAFLFLDFFFLFFRRARRA